jgi:hypothetical protein
MEPDREHISREVILHFGRTDTSERCCPLPLISDDFRPKFVICQIYSKSTPEKMKQGSDVGRTRKEVRVIFKLQHILFPYSSGFSGVWWRTISPIIASFADRDICPFDFLCERLQSILKLYSVCGVQGSISASPAKTWSWYLTWPNLLAKLSSTSNTNSK